jgi:hypothetical protein
MDATQASPVPAWMVVSREQTIIRYAAGRACQDVLEGMLQ